MTLVFRQRALISSGQQQSGEGGMGARHALPALAIDFMIHGEAIHHPYPMPLHVPSQDAAMQWGWAVWGWVWRGNYSPGFVSWGMGVAWVLTASAPNMTYLSRLVVL
jgi:hypothetical protein